MESAEKNKTVEDLIRVEFQAAFAAVDSATGEDKPLAMARLNRAVRRLYDLVGHGKLPSDWRLSRDE